MNIPIVEEELFARLNKSFGENTNAVIAVYHHNFSVTIGIDRVIGEANLFTLSGRVDNKI